MDDARIKELVKKGPHRLTPEEIDEINQEEFRRSKEEYDNFKSNFENGICSYCNKELVSFDNSSPCFHWFLMPPGIKKQDFSRPLKKYGCMQIQAYLRWVANQEIPLGNINDLSEEKKDSRVFEVTIKYKNIEWTFCCTNSDHKGHSGRFNYPHYHLQIRNDGQRFINFHDFHNRLTEEDLDKINLMKNENPFFGHGWGFGSGMEDAFTIPPKEILAKLKAAPSEEKDIFHLQTIMEAKPGETIKGDDIADAIEESKKTGKPIASILQKMKGKHSVKTIISPGEGVPKIKHRYSRSKKRAKKIKSCTSERT